MKIDLFCPTCKCVLREVKRSTDLVECKNNHLWKYEVVDGLCARLTEIDSRNIDENYQEY